MELYWWLCLTKLHDFAGLVLTLQTLVFGLTLVLFLCSILNSFIEFDFNQIKPYCKFFFLIFFITGLTYVFVPQKSDLAIMFGWDALKSNDAKEIGKIVKQKLEKL